MAPKRKAAAWSGPAKAGRISAVSTPGPATPRSLESPAVSDGEDDPLTEEQLQQQSRMEKDTAQFAASWDISASRFQQRPKDAVMDSVSSHFGQRDFSYLHLKPDHENRPLWIDPTRAIIVLERWNRLAEQATDFLITIAEPDSRPTWVHEYKLTIHSLYAAVSVGLAPQDIINTLDRFLKTPIPDGTRDFILACTKDFGKVKIVIRHNKYFVESADAQVLQKLLKDGEISRARKHPTDELTTTHAPKVGGLVIPGTKDAAGLQQAGGGTHRKADGGGDGDRDRDRDRNGDDSVKTAAGGDGGGGGGGKAGGGDEDTMMATLNEDDDEEKEDMFAFEIEDDLAIKVSERCLGLGYPILSEYDFRNDDMNATLDIDLKPNTQIRPYQEKSLSKMFGNGRAKSGIIVLPCGAGKTLVGITAACTIKKGIVVMCTSGMSVVQWQQEFLKWSNIHPHDVALFTSDHKSTFSGNTGIVITTYNMVTQTKNRAHDAQKMMDFIRGREWGLMLLDEVHVAPAQMFQRVLVNVKAHAKLGLTATLLREDDKISHLNYLVGPKLYEANWMELSAQGHIARVQCAEVWCPMPPEFYDRYLAADHRMQKTLYAMNPRKFQACQYLINYHEARGDKIIVFSDELYALKQYALKLNKVFIYGGTSQSERMHVLQNFQHNPAVNTLFLSKIGDTSLDLPEATCLIQISSHFGSRRQEAQRLGRILRAKRRNDEGFNAFFYSLVSKDTQEMYFSTKRQAFLVDQGYVFKVITQLANLEKTPELAFARPQERLELLAKTLVDNEKGFEEDDVKDDLQWSPGAGGRRRGPRRTAATLADLSGGQTMAYVEQNRGANRQLKKDQKAARNPFFKKVRREVEKAVKGSRQG